MKSVALVAMIGAAMVVAPPTAWAHKPSDAHLQLAVSGDRITGSLAVAIRDLDGALDLDFDGNGDITWNEVTTAASRIQAYEIERLAMLADGEPCTYSLGPGSLADFSDGAYWTVSITGSCPSSPDTIAVAYKLLFDIDAQHRGIVSIASAGQTVTHVARDATPIRVELPASSLGRFAARGIEAVATSPLQLFFLVCLALPAVVVRTRARGVVRVDGRRATRHEPASSIREVVPELGAIIAGLGIATIATLVLAASNLVGLPDHLVEVAVAATVVAIAILNLVRADDARWELVFELGLVQGVGFAIALARVDAGMAAHVGPTVAFALGIVVTEAAVVAGCAAIAFALRRTLAYQVLLWGGSSVAVLVGAIWTLQAWVR